MGTAVSLYHGGVPGLAPGDLIEPGHKRRSHKGCPWCEARDRGEAHEGTDPPSGRPDRVYATGHRLYAKHHASLWGAGDLYRVEPVGEAEVSEEDTIPSVCAPALRVVSVLDRAVRLTDKERRRLLRDWTAADRALGLAL